jgi:hypothetical protein
MQAKSKRLVQIIVLVLIGVVIVGGVAFWSFGNISESSSFGKVSIPLPDGSTAYVIRESWGLHTDQIAVSQNPDGCVPADPQHDYIDSDAHSVIYSEANGRFILYENAPPYSIHRPLQPWKGDVVSVHSAVDPSWGDLHSEPKKYGAVVLEVPLNEFCWSHMFRPTTSLRPKP